MVVHLVSVLKAGPFCWPDREKKEVDSEYWDQDQNLAIFCVRINFDASWELHSKYWDSEKCEASDNKHKYFLQNEDWNPKPRSWQWNWDNWVIDQRSRTVFRPRSLKWNLLNKWGWAVFKVSLVAISFNLVLLRLGSDVSLISLTSLRSHSVNL